MAIDFPNSPTPGQEFQGYYWDNSKQAWRSQSTNRGSVITSATTPTGATAGDLWFNTVDGTMYVYYDDGITTQWVEIQANVDNYKTPSQNYIINGGFDIWQRGTSFSLGISAPYTADRWQAIMGGGVAGMTVSRQNSGLQGFQYSLRAQRDSGVTSTSDIQVMQSFETLSSIPLANKTITFSFYARSGANFSSAGGLLNVNLRSGTGVDQNVRIGSFGGSSTQFGFLAAPLTTTWNRFSVTATVPSNTTQIGLIISNTPVGTAGSSDWYEITGVQLEEGTVATPFRRNQPNIQGELAACQRYYWRFSGEDSSSSFGPLGLSVRISNSTQGFASGRHPVVMRARPNLETSAANGFTLWTTSSFVLSSIGTDTVSPHSFTLLLGTSGLTAGHSGILHTNSASANNFIGFSAEL